MPGSASCARCGSQPSSRDRFCRNCGAALAADPALASRKNVVVLFVDLVGSTALAATLDPEPLREFMDRYYRICTETVHEHGGVIEKFIGDAVMACFGTPFVHEDDPIRAVRAALGISAAVRDLRPELAIGERASISVHCGIFAGEVIATTLPGGDLRVVGDTVNMASRLQSAAAPGEILAGKSVADAVRAHVQLRPAGPFALKGKAEPVPAWQVTGLRADPLIRSPARFTGRDDEIGQLRQAFHQTVRHRRFHSVTVLGSPGLGKTRLLREFLSRLGDEPVTVLTGHCRSYGKGVTYQPIMEMIESLPGGPASLPSVLAGQAGRDQIGKALAAIGQDASSWHGGIEEIAWAVRGLFRALAADRPVIAVCDDLHWAEPTLLDLLHDLATGLDRLPVLLVCLARPELLDARPGWQGGATAPITIDLQPLRPAQMRRLIRGLSPGPGAVRQPAPGDLTRIAEVSGGNPQFAELMFDMAAEGGEMAIPPTVQALLAARVDRLRPDERNLLAQAATIGQQFSPDSLLALAEPAERRSGELAPLIVRVCRLRLVEQAAAAGGYRFAQALTREVVYAMTPKTQRLGWHLRLADWLTSCPGSRESPDVAYHLEAACQLAREVSPGDPGNVGLARRASAGLATAGTRALARKDLPAAAGLLTRARELMRPGDPGLCNLAIRISDAWLALGASDRALTALDHGPGPLTSDVRCTRALDIQRGILAVRSGTADGTGLAAMCDQFSAALADDPDDHLGWCRVHQLQALSWLRAGQVGRAEAAMREAATHARDMGDQYEEERLLIGHCELAQWSPAHVDAGLTLCAELSARFAEDRALLVVVVITQARLTALKGDLACARDLLTIAGRYAADLQLKLALAAVSQARGLVESLAGAHGPAERLFTRAARELHAMRQSTPAQTLEIYAARERWRAGAPADEVLRLLPGEGAALELRAKLAVACLRASLHARTGRPGEADRLASAATSLLTSTDDRCLQGDVLAEVAQVRQCCGQPRRAAEAARLALRYYRERGAELPASRVTAWLAAAGLTASPA